MKRRQNYVKYHINYWVARKQKQEFVGYSIEEARAADGKRRSQISEDRGDLILERMAEEKTTFNKLRKQFLEDEKRRMRSKGLKEYPKTEYHLASLWRLVGPQCAKETFRTIPVGLPGGGIVAKNYRL